MGHAVICRRNSVLRTHSLTQASIIGSGVLPVRERLDVLLEALFIAFLDDGPLAVVDAAVAAALDGEPSPAR